MSNELKQLNVREVIGTCFVRDMSGADPEETAAWIQQNDHFVVIHPSFRPCTECLRVRLHEFDKRGRLKQEPLRALELFAGMSENYYDPLFAYSV